MNFDQLEMERMVEWILKEEPSSTNRVHRPYFLVIFNNRQWSDYFRRRHAEDVQRTNRGEPPILRYEPIGTVRQSWLEHQFSCDLHRLINGYLQQTQRGFPLKFFIDFTDY